MNNWLLTLFVASARASVRGRAVAACRYSRPILSLALDGRGDGEAPVFLNAILSRSGSFAFLADTDPLTEWPAQDPFPQLKRYSVDAIEQPNADRIVRLALTRLGHENLTLDLILFGSDAGLSAAGKPVASLNRRTAQTVSVEPRRQSSFASISISALSEALTREESVPGLDPRLLGYFPHGRSAAEPLIEFRDSISPGAEPFWLLCPAKLSAAVPAPAPARMPPGRNTLIGPFTGSLAACAIIGRLLIAAERNRQIEYQLKPLRSLLSQKKSLLAKLRMERRAADGRGIIRKRAEILAAYQARVPAGAASVELPDPYSADETVTIELDPSRPLRRQIDKLFKLASKMERSIPFLEKKIHSIETEIDTIKTHCTDVRTRETITESLEAADTLMKTFHLTGRGPTAPGPAEKSYRKFDLDPMWFVLVGRNNRENDELTFHAATPSDHWFHAQQVPGSHVILKSHGSKSNPSEAILEAAAAVAAFYSKAKHSTIVPVIYTLRKYVRKPRKAPPGQVICSHEKTIFAKPGLPNEEPH